VQVSPPPPAAAIRVLPPPCFCPRFTMLEVRRRADSSLPSVIRRGWRRIGRGASRRRRRAEVIAAAAGLTNTRAQGAVEVFGRSRRPWCGREACGGESGRVGGVGVGREEGGNEGVCFCCRNFTQKAGGLFDAGCIGGEGFGGGCIFAEERGWGCGLLPENEKRKRTRIKGGGEKGGRSVWGLQLSY
jgi:hypothetical protein